MTQHKRNAVIPNLRAMREAAGLTRQQLANDVGCAHSTIQALEEPGTREPGYALVRDLAQALGCSMDNLFLTPNTRIQVEERKA
jgi:transcriptional regulator with XRE-family HTH domain